MFYRIFYLIYIIIKNITELKLIIEEQSVPTIAANDLDEGFTILECAPISHRFRLSLLQPSEPRIFHQAVGREIKLLKSDLPPGVIYYSYHIIYSRKLNCTSFMNFLGVGERLRRPYGFIVDNDSWSS